MVQYVRVADMEARRGVAIESAEDLSDESPLLAGDFLNCDLREGLRVHMTDAQEQYEFTATSSIEEGLNFVFFLNGHVDLEIGGKQFSFDGGGQAALLMNRDCNSFRRSSTGRQRVRHLVVSASRAWLTQNALSDLHPNVEQILSENLVEHRWRLSPRLTALIGQMFTPPSHVAPLRRLHLESRALELVAESLLATMHAERPAAGAGTLNAKEMRCLIRARAIIAEDPCAVTSVATVARAAGINESGLQRLFRIGEGKSVFEYIRLRRIEMARSALEKGGVTSQEAATMAGYQSAANFATAFKRVYGITPREVAHRIPR